MYSSYKYNINIIFFCIICYYTIFLKIKQWTKYYKSGKKPDDIPSLPQRTYKEEFVSIGDWLGTGSIGGIVKAANYLSWSEAQPIYKKLAKQYGLNGRADWNRFAKTHQKLLDELRIPLSPWRSYSRERGRGRNK